ncbi:MAG: hypothetical protein LBL34_05960 [Clostridiales bacterium]|jgi:Zn finger protein HypA/HybF involved in hydrogenase expression|nr:hypothetical protein [Clostridiales bacterium]
MNFPEPKIDSLKKLFEELDFDENSREGKMFGALLEAYSELEGKIVEQNYRMDEIDEDLAEVENEFYGEAGEHELDSDLFEMTCPGCHEKVYIDQEMLDAERTVCPNCNTEINFEVDLGDLGGCAGGCDGCGGGCV